MIGDSLSVSEQRQSEVDESEEDHTNERWQVSANPLAENQELLKQKAAKTAS